MTPIRPLSYAWLALLVAAHVGLSGCASAPGMRMAADSETTASQATLHTISPELIAQQQQVRRESTPALLQLLAPPEPYTIGPSDILSIVVWEHPELLTPPTAVSISADGTSTANGYTVDSEGRIQFAYAKHLKVAGLTEAQARDALTQVLSQTLRKPEVTLRVQSYRSQRVYIEGEVRAPGVQPITDVPMTLAEALNRAGGATALGDTSRLQLSRGGQTTSLNLPGMVAAGIHPGQLLLRSGDLLRVPSKDEARIFVLGEVQRPGPIVQRNGRLSLNEALGEAAGVNPLSGNAAQVYVVRPSPTTSPNASAQQPQVFHLDARSPVALLLAEQFELQPRDVVYVDPTALANWNRVVSLVLPSAALANTTNSTFK